MYHNAEWKGFVLPTNRKYRCRNEQGQIVYKYPEGMPPHTIRQPYEEATEEEQKTTSEAEIQAAAAS